MADNPSRIEAFLQSDLVAGLSKHFKRKIFSLANEEPPIIKRISSGIFPLDYVLAGGWPVGRVNIIFGPKASGKTTTLLRTIGNIQKMCANCWVPHNPITGEIICTCKEYREPIVAFIDVEGSMDFAWAGVLGADMSKVLYSEPEYGEQAIDIFDALLRSGEADGIILDSVAFLIPIKEVEESVSKALMGNQPLLIGKMTRKLVSGLIQVGSETGRRPTVFLTNQIRNKMTMFGNPEVVPGGFALPFAAATEVRTSVGKSQIDEGSGRTKSVEIDVKMEKNKCGPTRGMETSYRLIVSDTEFKKKGQVQDEDVVMMLAEQVGLIEKGKGNKWTALGKEFAAKSHVDRALLTDAEFSFIFRTELMKRLLATM